MDCKHLPLFVMSRKQPDGGLEPHAAVLRPSKDGLGRGAE